MVYNSQKNEAVNMSQIIIYKPKMGNVEIKVNLDQETVWLSLNQMSDLFGRDKSVISPHLRNLFKTRELEREEVVAKFATTSEDGKIYQVDYYRVYQIKCVN